MSSKFSLQASLVLNVVFAFTVVALVLPRSEDTPVSSVHEAGPRNEISLRTRTDKQPVFAPQPRPMQYTSFASASDRRRWMVDQLRAAGVPIEMLARLALSDLDEQWEREFETNPGDADSMAAMQLEHDMSKDAEMRAALGEEGFRQWDQQYMLREAISGKIQLTASETAAIYDLKKTLQKRQWEFEQARLKRAMDDAQINEASEKSYSEFNRQMKALLGDERHARSMGMDDDTAAANLRHDLSKLNPSDSQFQQLLGVQQQWNERRAEVDKQFQDDPASPAYADLIKDLNEARDREYRDVLGAEVFDTLQKEQDHAYSTMKKYAELWGLDDNKMDHVYGAMKYYEKSVRDYGAQARHLESQGQSVDWNAVNKNLQQFVQQTEQVLQNYLGQDRFDKMRRNGLFQFNQ
jgi:hypothetical protein